MARIVVGVDPSAAGAAGLRYALREAVARGLAVTAVRAWSVPAVGSWYPTGSLLAAGAADAATEAQVLADEQVKLARDEVPGAESVDVSTGTVRGLPAQVLVDAGRGAVMVVVGRGAGVLSRVVLGSVSAAVLHSADCPVVVVPEEHETPGQVRRVLVGVDHSAESLAALRFAAASARHHDAVLVPVCVHEELRTGPGDAFDLGSLELSERQSLLGAAEAHGAAGLRVEPEVLTGHPAGTLSGLTTVEDLLVLGSRGRGGFAGLLLGSTSTQCSQHAACPVAVVRHEVVEAAPAG